ncbi:hypothetical protein [Bacillus thuringiensis]|uniref:hypothetical protein n=1 Tax=Bacillus thuringiensis TaxID=1428 RepID=UPI0026E3272B|nr:hypothetical protein [Bacillus thuringiensis]MDO6634364.1 hypothetical protein [Bacillus thuringiensis]MDO6663636.1 hypothetical protein [Bacillus thuringiensis]MDO6704524.1 hypothetical protein [Bacillus thuringiensis]
MKSYEILITYKDDNTNRFEYKSEQSKEELQGLIAEGLNTDVEFLSFPALGVVVRRSEVRVVLIDGVK